MRVQPGLSKEVCVCVRARARARARVRACVRVFGVRVFVYVRVRARARACVGVGMRAYVCVCARVIYNSDGPRVYKEAQTHGDASPPPHPAGVPQAGGTPALGSF